MMDQLIITLVLINIFTQANGELHCLTCSNCPNADDLDYNMSQRCDFILPPSTLPTSPPNTPPTSPPNTPPTTSSANTPPTRTTTPSTVNDSNVTDSIPLTIGIDNNSPSKSDYDSEKTTEKSFIISTRNKRILSQTLYENIVKETNYQCFRITRNVDDKPEVVRGCVMPASTLHETCVRANSGVSPITCRICAFDDCNAARRDTTSSIIIMFTSIVSMTLLR